MKINKTTLIAACAALAAALLPVGESQAAPPVHKPTIMENVIAKENARIATLGPLLNVYNDAGYQGGYAAQFQASNCGTVGSSARQEYWISWPARVRDSSFKAITTYPYCNVIGVHAYAGNWYLICTMSTRNSYGDYGIAWFGSSANNWYNDNVDVVMIGYFYGCPLNN